MTRKRSICAMSLAFLACLIAEAADGPRQNRDLDREFQAAVAQYHSGHYPEAASKLENLVREAPESFEVQELLGLVYSAQSQDARATQHLQKAVHLKPNSAPARTNLAANLARLGKLDLATEQFKKAVELDPRNFDTNHNLGEAYVRSGKIADAASFLEKAQQINPSAYDNGYDLSLAYIQTGRLADARQLIQDLLKRKNTAELHNLLGEVEEKDGKFVAAENEYETAAHMEPSESNLFDWGSELLLHRTLGPAVEVFQQAAERYPASQRLAIGLGVALYYYAMSLWKGKRAQDPDLDLHQIESLLSKSLAIDPKLAEAHLQLGNLYSDQNKYAQAIPEYTRALELSSDLADAYYRLGQAYVRTGDRDRAQQQFQVYQRLREQHLADLDKQRAEIRQFVYSAKDSPSAKP